MLLCIFALFSSGTSNGMNAKKIFKKLFPEGNCLAKLLHKRKQPVGLTPKHTPATTHEVKNEEQDDTTSEAGSKASDTSSTASTNSFDDEEEKEEETPQESTLKWLGKASTKGALRLMLGAGFGYVSSIGSKDGSLGPIIKGGLQGLMTGNPAGDTAAAAVGTVPHFWELYQTEDVDVEGLGRDLGMTAGNMFVTPTITDGICNKLFGSRQIEEKKTNPENVEI